MDLDRFQDAIARFDAANAQDPRGIELPYAQRLSAWVERLRPDASETLRLAARCQHLRRWEIPRESYPAGRIGYLKWREDLKRFHAEEAGKILRAVGYDDATTERVQKLNLKKLWPKDPEACVLEDALCLLFLEMQFDETTAKIGDEKMMGILQKTWRKMTPQAREIAHQMKMTDSQRRLIETALNPHPVPLPHTTRERGTPPISSPTSAGGEDQGEGAVRIATTDPVNAKILAVSEDQLQGFQRDPLGEIARQSDVELPVVIERLCSMLCAGTIRRVRQTLLATNLAQGALVAWQVPEEKLNAAFDWMFQYDPFSGHVVIRTTDAGPTKPSPRDAERSGRQYRLWTTLKVPQGFSMARHCEFLCRQTGARKFVLLPAKKLFTLGVGHVRRRGLEPGSRAEVPAEVLDVSEVTLTDLEWRVLTALKREFTPEELVPDIWTARAKEAGVSLEEFFAMAEDFDRRKIIGRFSTFLEHIKPLTTGEQVTRYNALFHWAVPPGREIDAGREVGRHHIMTHAYWREGGPEFHNVNIMGVAHGTDKALLLAHKAAIDDHLREAGIPILYTNVFWGGRSEIKPSEISPVEYRKWADENRIL